MAVFSEAALGMAECDTSFSVPKTPDARPTSPRARSSVPVVITNGLPDPASVAPIASIARRSTAAPIAMSEKSCT